MEHISLRPPAEKARLAACAHEAQIAIRQWDGIKIMKRAVGQLPRIGPVHANRSELPIGVPSHPLPGLGTEGEVDRLRVEIRHRMSDDAVAAVEDRFEFGPGRREPAFMIPWDMQDANAAAREEQRIKMIAVIVRRLERMSFGEQHPLQRRPTRGSRKNRRRFACRASRYNHPPSPSCRLQPRGLAGGSTRSAPSCTSRPCSVNRSISSSNCTSTRSSDRGGRCVPSKVPAG